VFKETASGAKAHHVELHRAVMHLANGGVLMLIRLDRLARSTRDFLNTLHQLF